MALQVWLPLNGNIKNQGLSGVAVSLQNGTATYNNSGKIGECFNNCSAGSNITIPCDFLSDQLTITFWVKPNSPNAWMDLFSIGQYASRMETNTATGDMYYSFCDNDNYGLTAQSQQLFSLTNDVWHHIAYSVDGINVKVYHNGILINTIAQAHPLSIAMGNNKTIYVGRRRSSESSHYEGYFNDFRIYDNALSDREIHEISKGIVMHYQFNDPLVTRSANKYSGETAAGKCSHGSFTCTKLADERGYNYSMQCTGNGNDKWYIIGFPTISFEVGKTYDYSCKVRCNSANFSMQLRASRCCNDWSTKMVTVSNADGKWHEYHLRQTMTGTTFLRSGTTDKPNTAPELEFYTQSLSTNGTVYEGSFDIKDVQVCEATTSVDFSDGAFNNGVIYDCSGYGYDASINGKILSSSDSPRYETSTGFDESSSYISTTIPAPLPQFTIATWGKKSSANDSMMWGQATSNLNLYFYEGKLYWNTGDSLENPFQNNGSDISFTSDNDWHHYVITGDGTNVKLYIDGVYKGTAKKYKSFTKDIFTFNSWALNRNYPWSNGYLSDFRLYATALSDKDIKELYKAPITLTNTGALMTQGEFKEV